MKNPLGYIGNNILLNLLRIIFGSVFVLSGVMKIFNFADFIKAVRDFELLPTFIVPIFSYSLPILELILGLGLVMNFKPSLISNLLTYLVAIFTAVVVSKLIEGVQINCACFGNLNNSEITYSTANRNIILLCYGIFLSAFYTAADKKEIQNQQTGISQVFKQNKKTFLAVIKNSFAIAVFFFLSIQTIILSVQNKQLKEKLDSITVDKNVLQKGETANIFSAYNLSSGRQENVSFTNSPGQKTLLFIFSTHCSACKINLPNWLNLSKYYFEKNVRVIGISIDPANPTNEYIESNHFNFPVLIAYDPKFKFDYKAYITPQTIIVDDNGFIIKSYPGILDNYRINEIKKITFL